MGWKSSYLINPASATANPYITNLNGPLGITASYTQGLYHDTAVQHTT